MSEPVVEASNEKAKNGVAGCCVSLRPVVQVRYSREYLALDWIDTPSGKVPRVAANLTWHDRWGTIKVRLGIGRMQYTIEPGLYAIGRPSSKSPVLVTANYKLSFDHLRSNVAGLDAWILILDTDGINVWCAAGKGSFGTEEMVRRIGLADLAKVVSHRRLIVPQLGAPGTSAHEVQEQSGFTVIYGPVRASDLPEFLEARRRATPEMRRVRFSLRDRAVLSLVELTLGMKPVLIVAALLLVLAGLGPDGYSLTRALQEGSLAALVFAGAYFLGVTLTPVLLPWLPGRAFSIKGAWLGLVLALGAVWLGWVSRAAFENHLTFVALLLFIPALTSFLALNFTGASTYTSLSGVRKETAAAVPVQIVCAVMAACLWLADRFV